MSKLSQSQLKASVKLKFSVKGFSYLLLITSLLGAQLISADIGSFKLSPYRFVLLLSPLAIPFIDRKAVKLHKLGVNYQYFNFLKFWLLYSLILLPWVDDFSSWSRIFIFLLSGYITSWFIGWYMNTKEDIIVALRIVESLAIFFASFAFYEMITGNYMFLSEDNLSFYGGESLTYSSIGYRIPVSIFGNPNHYAVFLLFASCFSFCLYKIKKTTIGRNISLISSAVFVFLLIATQSRASFIGFMLSLVVYVFINLRRSKTIKILFALLFILILALPWLSDSMGSLTPLLTIDSDEIGSDMTRKNLIRNGFLFLNESYYMGVGLGNIEYNMQFHGEYDTGDITNIHNWWMEILVSSGIIVLLFYVKVFFMNLKYLYRLSSKSPDPENRIISSIFFSLLVGFIVASIGPSSLLISEWFLPLMVIIMSFVNLYKNI